MSSYLSRLQKQKSAKKRWRMAYRSAQKQPSRLHPSNLPIHVRTRQANRRGGSNGGVFFLLLDSGSTKTVSDQQPATASPDQEQ